MKITGKRHQILDGVPVTINWRTTAFNNQCCDCGLTHDFLFRVKGSKLTIVVFKDRRTTAQVRRHLPNVRVRQMRER